VEHTTQQASRFKAIQHVLDALCVTYNFEAVLLVGREGLPLAFAKSSHDPEKLAAITAIFRKSAHQIQSQMAWDGIEEVTATSRDGHRLVGRLITLEEEEFILVILLPYWISYRKATTEAIEAIRRAWRNRKHDNAVEIRASEQ
jgi:predicted regulator of Ras-like GTPase activity (Roadblock/LC7/MglB family)